MARTTRQSSRKRGTEIGHLVAGYKEFVNVVGREMEDILTGAAEIVLEETLPLVPIETGALRQSGVILYEQQGRDFRRAVVQFGGDTAVTPTYNAPAGRVDYALIVHEDMDAHHPVGQAKFLKAGASSARDRVDSYVQRRLKEVQAAKEAKRASKNTSRRKTK